MEPPLPPWYNVVVRYCPRCRREYPPAAERCDEAWPAGTPATTPGRREYPPMAERCHRCGGALVDRVRREKVEDR